MNTSSVGSADTFPSRGRLMRRTGVRSGGTENRTQQKSTGEENAFSLAFPLRGRWVAGTHTINRRRK